MAANGKRGRGIRRNPAISAPVRIKGEKKAMPRWEAIAELMRRGLYLRDAAAITQISESAVTKWLSRGEEWIDAPDAEVPTPEKVYVRFVRAVESARGEAVEVAVEQISAAARNGVWQAAAWYLERVRPQQYARIERREVSGPGGGPITLLDLEREVAEEIAE